MAEAPAPESPEPPGIPRQNRAYGWLVLVTSWIVRLAGGAVVGIAAHEPLTIFSTASDPGYNGPWPWVVVIISIVAMVLGLMVLGAGLTMGRRARRHLVRVITSVAELRPRSYVLYLRPFWQDLTASGIAPPQDLSPDLQILRSGRTHEERLARMFRQFGPMVTVGRPGEALPAGSGACRFYLPRNDWQDPVRGLIGSARVILLGAGPGAGTIWEYAEVLRRAHHYRLVVLVTDPEWYARFKALTTAQLRTELPELTGRYGDQWQPPALPSLPHPRRPKLQAFYFRAMIYFGPGWEASLASFDRSAVDSLGPNRYVRKRLKPVLAHLRTAGTIDPVLVSRPAARPAPGPPLEPVLPPEQPPGHRPLPPPRPGNPPASPASDLALQQPLADTTFTNMPSRFTLALVRAGWFSVLIGGAVGSVIIDARFSLGDALIALVVYCVLAFPGTVITGVRLARWRTLVLDSRGFAVSVASLREDQHRAGEAHWEQVVRIGSFGQPGKPVLCAWVRDAGLNPSRLVRLCPAESPDFPIDAILERIRRYNPVVAIEPPDDQLSGRRRRRRTRRARRSVPARDCRLRRR
jgi:hypothetical protein